MIFKTMRNRLHRPLLSRENALFFSVLFASGGLPSSDTGCMFLCCYLCY